MLDCPADAVRVWQGGGSQGLAAGAHAAGAGHAAQISPMPLIPSRSVRLPVHRRHVLWSLSRHAVRLVVGLLLALWSLLLIGWLTLHWGILPHIDEWRPQIEQRASQALGLPVRIGRIEVSSSGWVPALELHAVVLSGPDGREALRLPRVSAALSPQSLFAWQLRFAQLYIEGPELEIRRDIQGRWHVGGLDMDSSAALDDGAALDWLFEQHEFTIRHGTLRWVDQLRATPPLELRDADLVMRNGLRGHDLRLDATPPAGWGERFSVRGRFSQPLLARSGDWRSWSGTLFAELPSAEMAGWRAHLTLPVDLRAGSGAARLWLDLSKGQWRRATLDAALEGVDLRLGEQLDPLVLQRLTGRFEAERSGTGMRLAASDLGFTMADGSVWPASRWSLAWRQVQDLERTALSAAPVSGGEFSADALDLALMAGIAGRLPLPAPLREALAELAPTGHVQALQGSWSGRPDQPERYRVKGRVAGLSMAAAAGLREGELGRPGWRNADIEFDAQDSGGEARLLVTDGAIELPGVFAEPVVPLDRFSGRFTWRIEAPRAAGAASSPALPAIELRLQDGQFANADARGDLQLTWRTGTGAAGRTPGVLDLTGRIEQGRAASVARYIPKDLPQTRDYLAGAIRDGTVRQARVRLRGDLRDFPFARPGDGEFRVSAQAENVTLAYVPPLLTGGVQRWPEFTQVNGELLFDRQAMQIRDARARLWGIELKGVNGRIANLLEQPTLAIEGGGRGPLNDALRFIGASPVGGWLSQALREASGSGAAELKLALQIPLDDADRSTVKGSVALAGNELRLRPDVPLLGNVRTRIDFTQRGFSLVPGTARALGGDLSFDGGSAADGAVRVNVQGVATADGLRAATELGLVPRMAQSTSGQAAYKLQLGITQGQTEMLVTSPLAGLALDLPAPLKKPAAATWPLRFQTQLQPATAAGALPRDTLQFSLGGVLQASYLRELGPEGARVLRGALAVGEAVPPAPPTAGVAAAVQLPQVNLDAWVALAKGWLVEPRAGALADAGYAPADLSLRAGQSLTVAGRRFGPVAATVQRRGSGEAEVWRAQLQAEQAQGQVEWRPAGAGLPWPRLQARLARLSVPAVPDAEADAGVPDASASLLNGEGPPPALDIVVDELEWGTKRLGRLELDARPAEMAAPRDWRIAKLNLGAPEARLSGTGLWTAARKRMLLDVKLDVQDGGAMLERFGSGKQLRGGKGRAQGQLQWTGAPLSPEWAALSGNLQLSLDQGQFLKAEPGAARLLGVLSLQSLPRRLTLDFRDVFQQGFAFDNLSADVALAEGVARTNNLRIRGVQAAVLIEGQADLRRETQDLHMVVVPEINAGTASLAYAVINPAIGLGSFLAQLFLRKPLMQAGTREFHVTGPWADPQVATVERAGDAPLPDMDGPAASASAPALAK